MPASDRPRHRRRPPVPARQRGVALLLLITLLVLGAAWYAVGALGRAAPTSAEREINTGASLRKAKRDLLAYVAQYAARSGTIEPGQMPCPELLSSIGTANQGQAATSCSNSAPTVGRLPWETLGEEEIRDGHGEPIWYVLSPGFRNAPINFESPGQLTYNGNPNAAVALLIAPGTPLNTASDPATPPAGCTKVNQQTATRNTGPLVPANFLECGNDSGTASYAIPGPSEWTNDRVIAISAAEWAQAIAGPVADRLQREVAPALNDWLTTESLANWGPTSFLPYASTFSKQTANDLCGDVNVTEGILPTAPSSSTSCTSWTGGTVTGSYVGFPSCGTSGANYQCRFYISSSGHSNTARIRAAAPNVGQSFRARITAGAVTNSGWGSVASFSLALNTSTGSAALDFQITFPWWATGWTTVTFPQLPDGAILSDTRFSWFATNEWSRDTYYALAPGATLLSASCLSSGSNCLTLSGMPLTNGNPSDKKLILTLMGPNAVGTETQPSNNPINYLESHAVGSTTYTAAIVTSSFNDRLAACPFQQMPASGSPIAICN